MQLLYQVSAASEPSSVAHAPNDPSDVSVVVLVSRQMASNDDVSQSAGGVVGVSGAGHDLSTPTMSECFRVTSPAHTRPRTTTIPASGSNLVERSK